MAASALSFFMYLAVAAAMLLPAYAQLCPDFYDKICPQALPTIRGVVEKAIQRQPRTGAQLLRMHFHDCFVNGCDGSVLLDDTASFTGEKTALPNLNSLRGFEVIDDIKEAVNSACHGNVVSCADVVAVAARDSVAILGGPNYQVLLGRRDARTASRSAANRGIPPPTFNFARLLASFRSLGLSHKDLIVLYGGHSIGVARCTNFRNRIYNETNIDPGYAASLRQGCPRSGGDNNTAPLDYFTSTHFDNLYYKALVQSKGLLHSDQELFKGDGSYSSNLVGYYSKNPGAFMKDFGASMINMGNIRPLTGKRGEIRLNCRRIN